MSSKNAIAALGAGIGGFVQGKRLREEDDFKNLERDQKRKGIEAANKFSDEMKNMFFQQDTGITNGIAATQPSQVAPTGGIQPESNYKTPNLEQTRDFYQRWQMAAASNPYAAQTINPMLNNVRSMAMSRYAQDFKGDTSTKSGALDYAKYMAKGSAMFGDYMTPEKAIQMADTVKEAEDEGYVDALEAVHSGDVEKAKKIWNSKGKLKGDIVEIKPATYTLGGQNFKTNEVTYRGRDGQEHKINAFGALFNMSALKDQVSMQIASSKTQGESAPYRGISLGKTTDEMGNEVEHRGVIDQRTGKIVPIDQGIDNTPPDSGMPVPTTYDDAFNQLKQANPDATKEQIDSVIKQELPNIKMPMPTGINDKTGGGSNVAGIEAAQRQDGYKQLLTSLINDGHDTAPEMVMNFDQIAKNLTPQEARKILETMGPYIVDRADKGRYNLMRRKYGMPSTRN